MTILPSKKITKKDIYIPQGHGEKKGDNGKLIIIGGSDDYIGAVTLAGIAALRAGCDWVTIAAPEKVAWAINTYSPDLVTVKLEGKIFSKSHIPKISKLLDNHNSILIGNGIGRESDEAIRQMISLEKARQLPKVIDADGIKAISLEDTSNSILTPHRGELRVLIENTLGKHFFNQCFLKSGIIDISESTLASIQPYLTDNILVIKGSVDYIISKDQIWLNKTGNAGMTKAGTGDVLAGLAAGFVSQKLSLWQAAVNAAYINGMVGDLLLKKHKGYSYIASDLLDDIKTIINMIRSK